MLTFTTECCIMMAEVIGLRKKWSLGDKEKRAIEHAVVGGNMSEAAALVGVHRSTLWRWLQRPEARDYWIEKLYE